MAGIDTLKLQAVRAHLAKRLAKDEYEEMFTDVRVLFEKIVTTVNRDRSWSNAFS